MRYFSFLENAQFAPENLKRFPGIIYMPNSFNGSFEYEEKEATNIINSAEFDEILNWSAISVFFISFLEFFDQLV